MQEITTYELARNWSVTPDGRTLGDLPRPPFDIEWQKLVGPEVREAYKRDGVVHIPQLIHPEWLMLIEQGIRRNILCPGHNHVILHEGSPGAYLMDHDNYHANPEYQYLIKHSPIADIMKYVLDTENLWFFHDQIFVKRGGDNMPTFWHQDLPFWIIDGMQLGSMWISLDPLKKEQCLEFIPGSHLGTQYGGTTFNPDDPTEPVYRSLPRIPNIEANRDQFDIVSWDIQLGDAIILHPGVLHGGGGTESTGQRRTITIRFFGDDAVMDGRFEKENERPAPYYPGLNLRLKPGDPIRDDRFPKVR